MSERKVINKWYPPDFDPTKIPRARKPKGGQVTVRMMMPMSVRCTICVLGEEYLGVKIFRFLSEMHTMFF